MRQSADIAAKYTYKLEPLLMQERLTEEPEAIVTPAPADGAQNTGVTSWRDKPRPYLSTDLPLSCEWPDCIATSGGSSVL
jgi:hypothetical protein